MTEILHILRTFSLNICNFVDFVVKFLLTSLLMIIGNGAGMLNEGCWKAMLWITDEDDEVKWRILK